MKITSILLTSLLLGPTSGAIAKSNGETMTTHHLFEPLLQRSILF
jgi:hypothetical protein